jgi:CRISPR-associated protein Csd1
MSWIQKLYETYNNCQMVVGFESDDDEVPLLPLNHTTQKAQIEITIDGEGNFRRAEVIPKENSRTIIPCTEKSGGRTSGEAAHPLCDKLQYIAGDYLEFGGEKSSYNQSYIEQLDQWCHSNYVHPKSMAVFRYTSKGNIIKDLVENKILIVGDDGLFLKKWDKNKQGDPPEIFNVLNNQSDAFIRWAVEIPDDEESKVYKDASLWESWDKYYRTTKQGEALCLVTGEIDFIADQHSAKIRNDGDKAKLISSNDNSGFTFRGRFIDAHQAATVGLESSQKAHFALRWLISRQGYRKGDLAILAWATSGAPVPNIMEDSYTVLGIEELGETEIESIDTAQKLALQLKKFIAGYSQNLEDTTDIIVLGLDSASPGRMGITYYRELKGSDFLGRIESWHRSCIWYHKYRWVNIDDNSTRKKKKKNIPFVGAPSPNDITEAAYGKRVDDKLRKTTIERILPCIIDESPIPQGILENAVRRASNRIGIKDPQDKYENEWNKTLSIACALYNKNNRKENFSMTLDKERKTRDYLYGRLLAIAENIEEWALHEAKEERSTNAARLMQRFSERPYSTWKTLELSLAPYKARLGGKSKSRQWMIDEVMAAFEPNDFISDKRLSGEFLLGYHCQREALRYSAKKEQASEEENSQLV